MRRLDWFLAAIVASFLIAVVLIEASSLTPVRIGFTPSQAGGVAEVAMRRLVTHLPRPPILGVEPQ